MTLEQRLDQLEQQCHRIERKNTRLTTALALTVVTMCAAVTIAATGEKDGTFDTVMARYIFVTNDVGAPIVGLGADDSGNGFVFTLSAKGKNLVELGATVDSEGMIKTYSPNGKRMVDLTANDRGGFVSVFNKTGKSIAQIKADQYGSGVVGAYNRKGIGRTLQPGP